MKEIDFINIIKNISKSAYIGDDCAYLKDIGIVVTQDNFVEDVHFKKDWATPFQLGYKSTVINISDVLASGAKPEYVTVGLSIPKSTDDEFIEEFYRGVNAGLYGAELVGGDITSADKIFVSITAIGSAFNRTISSRSNAKAGYAIILSGECGSSAAGLNCLINGINNKYLIKSHLEPQLNLSFSEEISKNINVPYAMMDTSDGLADALYKIAEASNVTIKTAISKIPHNENVNDIKTILYGGEDYKLVAALPKTFLSNLSHYYLIGEVIDKQDNTKLIIDDKAYCSYNEFEIYNHFD